MFVVIQGDTVYRDRWRTEWREVRLRDTVHVIQQDTNREPYPVEVIKEKYRVPKSL